MRTALGFMGLSGAAAGAILAAGLATTSPAPAEMKAADVFEVDPVHSMVMFRIGHLGVSYTYGRFNEPTGSFNINFDNPESSVIDIELKAENVDTANDSRDKHLRSQDFFHAKEFPTIRFVADSFEKTDADEMEIGGDLTLHGVTKPITASLLFVGEGETRQGYKAGFEVEFAIQRSEFGMTKYLEGNALGDEVSLYVTVEGVRM